MTTDSTETRELDLEALLSPDAPSSFRVPPSAWGYGGLHGGLAMSIAAAAAQRALPEHALRSVTGQFYRPLRDAFAIEVLRVHAGRSVGVFEATITDGIRPCTAVTCLLGTVRPRGGGDRPRRALAPVAPVAPPPLALTAKSWSVTVPVLDEVEVRLAGIDGPDSDNSDQSLTAWVRLKDQRGRLSVSSLAFFLDALPPTYSAFTERGFPVPTLEFSAHFAGVKPASEWMLIRAQSTCASEDDWVTETVDVWDTSGVHLASARQLRLALSSASI